MEVNKCNNLELAYNQACVVFGTNKTSLNSWLYALISDCVLCPYKKIAKITNKQNTSVIFDSTQSWTWKLFNISDAEETKPSTEIRNIICELTPNLGPNGVYQVKINDNKCDFDIITPSTNAYTPLVIILAAVISIFALISIGKVLIKYWRKKNPMVIKTEDGTEARPVKKRIQSIDTFRGISILMMIFVNNGAGGYKFLEHATWNGLYIGDLVFPCFIWIMGFCIPIAITSQLSRGVSRLIICKNIIKRSCLLFFLGICLNTLGTDSQLENIRIFGVLQRFGVAYLVVGLIYAFLSKKKTKIYEHGLLAQINDCTSLLPQWILIMSILILHCIITFCLTVPGCPKGYIGPGGLHENGKYFNCTGGFAGYIDRMVLGVNHIYQRPIIDTIYKSGPFDPEGILGCLTTIFQTFLGVQAGKILRVYKTWKGRVIRWIMFAIIYFCIGCILHFTNYIPVNKNLWSLSFVFISTAIAFTLLTLCYLLVDVVEMWSGGPFRIPGMNALVMYIGHQICYQIFPFHWKFSAMNSHMWQTIAALWDVGLWTIIAYALHRKRIYISL
ncbi:hypothetical protein PV326_003006 [Microctonus aethiopoides]|nr:hypothetical protein PV326_003006 [Microctonus aethiopoides]